MWQCTVMSAVLEGIQYFIMFLSESRERRYVKIIMQPGDVVSCSSIVCCLSL